MLSATIVRICVIYLQCIAAKSSNEDQQREDKNTNQTVLTVAWVLKPPYTKPANASLISPNHGIVQDAILRYMVLECGLFNTPSVSYQGKGLEADSEFEMIELLRKNIADAAVPIFDNLDNRRYSEFPFFKIGDYPGTDFITTEDESNAFSVVIDAVRKSWPLLAVTLIFTAIAGIIMWALVSV